MSETLQLYVKSTSNCEGLALQTFELLSPTWTGGCLTLPFGPDGQAREVVGWTDLFTGRACDVHVALARWLPHSHPEVSGGPPGPIVGYLIWGGNSGVRILDEEAEPTPGVDDHLPAGYGRPIVWINLGDVGDLPAPVRAVVEREVCENCGDVLPGSASPYWLDEGCSIWLCDECAGALEVAVAGEEEEEDPKVPLSRRAYLDAGGL